MNNFSLYEIAEKTGVTPMFIQRWKNKKVLDHFAFCNIDEAIQSIEVIKKLLRVGISNKEIHLYKDQIKKGVVTFEDITSKTEFKSVKQYGYIMLGRNVRALRRSLGMSQYEFYHKNNIARSTGSQIEAGTYPCPEHLVKKLEVVYDIALLNPFQKSKKTKPVFQRKKLLQIVPHTKQPSITANQERLLMFLILSLTALVIALLLIIIL